MSTLKLGVDIDSTINQLHIPMSEKPGVDMSDALYIKDKTDMTEEEILDFFMEHGPHIHSTAPLKDEFVVPALTTLGRRYNMFFITNRNRERLGFDILLNTRVYMEQHGLWGLFSAGYMVKGSKQVYLSEANQAIDVMIEDNPEQALAFLHSNIPVILFDYPYNRHINHPLCTRVTNWQQAMEAVIQLEQELTYV